MIVPDRFDIPFAATKTWCGAVHWGCLDELEPGGRIFLARVNPKGASPTRPAHALNPTLLSRCGVAWLDGGKDVRCTSQLSRQAWAGNKQALSRTAATARVCIAHIRACTSVPRPSFKYALRACRARTFPAAPTFL